MEKVVGNGKNIGFKTFKHFVFSRDFLSGLFFSGLFNTLPLMEIFGSSNSATNKNVMS